MGAGAVLATLVLMCSALSQHCSFGAAFSALPDQLRALELLISSHRTDMVLPPPHSMLFLDNDMEYFVEPRMLGTGSSLRDDASLYRSRTSLGTSMGAEADWEILPEDILICKDPYGRDWQLGTGGFGSVRSPCSPHLQAHGKDAMDTPIWEAADAHLRLLLAVPGTLWVCAADNALNRIIAVPAVAFPAGMLLV